MVFQYHNNILRRGHKKKRGLLNFNLGANYPSAPPSSFSKCANINMDDFIHLNTLSILLKQLLVNYFNIYY